MEFLRPQSSPHCDLFLPFQRLEQLAKKARDQLGGRETWLNSRVNVDLLLERYADKIGWSIIHEFEEPLFQRCDSKTYGCCDYSERSIFLDCTEGVREETQRFAQAHELFHLAHHWKHIQKVGPLPKEKRLETNASEFARCLLLPPSEFEAAFYEEMTLEGAVISESDIPKIQDVVRYLAGRFGVPGFSAALRVKDLGLLGDREVAERWLLASRPQYLPKHRPSPLW